MQGRPKGLRYYSLMEALHQQVLFDWYLEIGCRQGTSFAPVRSKTIAVDPFFKAEINIIGKKPALHVFQQTSDAFFDGGFMQKMGIQLGASFLDGMHLFEYLLRDFRNTEAATHPDGVIMMHDCVPFTQAMTTRDLKNLPKGAWTGDVWKIIPILQRWRPDLKLTVLDCRPTGVVCVSNLSPGNRVLWDEYDRIVAEFLNVEFEDYGMQRFLNSFEYTGGQDMVDGGFQLFRKVAVDESHAINPRRVTK
jgi:hypothetical protein